MLGLMLGTMSGIPRRRRGESSQALDHAPGLSDGGRRAAFLGGAVKRTSEGPLFGPTRLGDAEECWTTHEQ